MDYQKDNYTMPMPFIISCNIREYDISKANISILLALGLIDKNEYDKVLAMPKMQREIYIGKLQVARPDVNNGLKAGFAKYRQLFIESNGLQDSDILSIKKDAIFVINKIPTILEFDNYVRFSPKGRYTSFFKIKGMEFYYLLDKMTGEEVLDVKGIDDTKLILHADYMVQFLCVIFEAFSERPPEMILELIHKFSQKYVNMELDLGYYREFNADSGFRITMNNTQYLLENALESEKPYLNISENYKLIQELYRLANLMYINKRR